MCSDLIMFNSLESIDDKQHTIAISDRSELQVTHKGQIDLGGDITLRNILHVLGFKFNLISISKLCCDVGCSIYFTNGKCFLVPFQ